MKKLLLGTSALVAASFVTVPAFAQLNLTISGYYRFDAAYVDETGDGTAGNGTVITTRNDDFSSRGRITFDVAGTADNGLRYGARLRLNQFGGSGNTIGTYSEAYGFVRGAFGQVAFGDIGSAGNLLRIYTPDDYGAGGGPNGVWSKFARGFKGSEAGEAPGGQHIRVAGSGPGFPQGFLGVSEPFDDVLPGASESANFSTKLVYTTTGIDLAGFIFGLSYAPEIGNVGRSYDRNASDTSTNPARGAFEDAISVALQYANPNLSNGIGVKAAGQYNHANARAADIEDLQSFMLGAQVSYASFTVGGHYIYNGNTGATTENGLRKGAAGNAGLFGPNLRYDDFNGWGVGGEYTVGPWIIGVSYFTNFFDNLRASVTPTPGNSQIRDYRLNAVGGGVGYTVAPGLYVGTDLVYYWEDISQRLDPTVTAIRENDGTVVSLRTQVNF